MGDENLKILIPKVETIMIKVEDSNWKLPPLSFLHGLHSR